MYCRYCGKEKGNNDTACPHCGLSEIKLKPSPPQPVEEPAKEVPVQQTKHETKKSVNEGPFQILARSENCMVKLSEWKNTLTKKLSIASLSGFIPLVALFFVSVVSDEKIDLFSSEAMAFGTLYLVLLLVLLSVIAYSLGKVNKQYETFSTYCTTESLIVDTQKIYGATAKEKIVLSYAEISEVHFALAENSLSGGKADIFTNVSFVITDKNGKFYTFFSFVNASELCEIINSHLE